MLVVFVVVALWLCLAQHVCDLRMRPACSRCRCRSRAAGACPASPGCPATQGRAGGTRLVLTLKADSLASVITLILVSPTGCYISEDVRPHLLAQLVDGSEQSLSGRVKEGGVALPCHGATGPVV